MSRNFFGMLLRTAISVMNAVFARLETRHIDHAFNPYLPFFVNIVCSLPKLSRHHISRLASIT